ncbi:MULTISPECIES: hypothetical protein [unclassified Dehalobacter]|jgi:hypothetical protein|uniref:hypothetical protein n=1 Tax=unclassified Dehalobacter TaxID=2635733 RepID=UPI00028A8E7E|nr:MULTISPECIES: hypothetical protein [unclassified Dehalobacter]AFV03489.1 hypothetical protein DHBDCA_p2462 [Dehalobacter sp. DCA]AFV06475.1 hypothetical protein DCF50_p2472 [Dehalobacter sp. CF]
MISLDEALVIYTDKITSGQDIDYNYFYENLAQDDIEEFKELSKIINMTISVPYTQEFDAVFKKINDYKEQLYSLPQAADFRKDRKDSDGNDDAQRIIDELFNEEFSDE